MPLVVYILGLTIFSLTTSEFMVAGMMPSLTQAFGVSVTQVGYLISFYAIGMVIGGPVLTLTLLTLRIPNKRALLCLMLIYACAQAVAAASDSYEVMVGARITTGVAAAACFGASLAICGEVVAIGSRARAASVVVGGLMLANVMGVPAATFIDQHWGWRASFWLVVILVAACSVLIIFLVPRSQAAAAPSLHTELAEFKKRDLWAAYLTSACIIGAAFAGFSYFTPILTEVTGFSAAAIPWLLGLYGVANVVGNMVIGRYADKYTFPILGWGLTVLAMAFAVFACFAHEKTVSVLSLVVVGLIGVALNPAMIARIMKASHPGALVHTMHSSVINMGLGLGSWLGGLAIAAGYGLRSPLWLGCALAVAGLLSVLPYLKRAPRSRP